MLLLSLSRAHLVMMVAKVHKVPLEHSVTLVPPEIKAYEARLALLVKMV